ncbi:MAG: 4-(cytidine 5'-diphospho)-2-C-methyl-D-erythritol kinase [Pyrinomonadaceae bacterium]|nr:4-(cytidine 5'-diphospho)-2-C-methyl-D-erythritol kinase [Pyrinomonadaceae bacterium]
MNRTSLTLPSFAKINWFLRVLGKRDDGFHELCTVFQTISLKDTISFTESPELNLTSDDRDISTDEQNLILRSARALKEKFEIERGAEIHIQKNIPFPGGLGGGSSNAAITLLALTILWDAPARLADLIDIGSGIGSDVSYFFYGGTAFGKGRGNQISGLAELSEKYLLIATPNIEVSTAEAFSKLGAERLTKNDSKSILQNCYDDAERLELGHLELVNDFEKVIFQIFPEIGKTKEKLLDFGAKHALMTGSGASVFGVFDNEETRQAAFESFSKEISTRIFAVETVSRAEYQEFLRPCERLFSDSF